MSEFLGTIGELEYELVELCSPYPNVIGGSEQVRLIDEKDMS